MDLKYEEFKEIIKKWGFDIDIESYTPVKEAVKYYAKNNDINGLQHYFKQLQNCAGYALQIPICIFSGTRYTFEEQVLRIMELYPFVRLLSDTELNEDEYIVKFRSRKTGHHFIRIDENGYATDKHESNLPSEFQGWGTLENEPEAVFAVLKQEYRSDEIKNLPQCNRDMYLNQDAYYNTCEDGYIDIIRKEAPKPRTFTDLLEDAYKNKLNSFEYNNKTFHLKRNKAEPEIIYICDETQILGEFYTDGIDFIIDLNEETKNSIFGFEPSKSMKHIEDGEIDKMV